MEKDFNKDFDKEFKTLSIVGCISISIFVIWDIFFKLSNLGYYYVENFAISLTFLMSIICYSFIFAIVKKASKATKICYIILFLITLVNQIKMSFTGEPIYFSDIKFLGKSKDLLEIVFGNISLKYIFKLIVMFSIYAAFLIGITIINKKNDLELKNKKLRIGIILVDIIILLILFFPNNYTKNIFLKVFFNNDHYEDFDSYTNNTNYYIRNGFINGMYGTYLNSKFFKPENYNEEVLTNILENDITNNEKKWGKPNIILMFSEAFWDIDQLEEIEFNQPITSNFNKLKEKGKFINSISPSYGGMSENVAFEVLTGGSMNYFPRGYIPIMSLYTRKNSSESSSLVKVLKNNGYYSKIIFGRDYYNSRKSYLKMGFDEYRELDYKNEIISDEYFTNFIIKELENKNKNIRNFYTLETLESHMPFSKDKYANYSVEITKSNLDKTMQDSVRTYAQGIYNADKQLGRLYEYIQSFDEPTILIFLGDHLPYLYTENNENVIDHLEYFNTSDELLNYYRLYNIQALVLSNCNIDISKMPDYLGTDMLLNYVIGQMDIKNDKYYDWLNNTINDLPASNRYVSLDGNGNRYNTNNLEGKMKEAYNLRNFMQYKFLIKN